MAQIISTEKKTYPEDGLEEDPEEGSLVRPQAGIPAAGLQAACSGGSQVGAGEPLRTLVEPRNHAEP